MFFLWSYKPKIAYKWVLFKLGATFVGIELRSNTDLKGEKANIILVPKNINSLVKKWLSMIFVKRCTREQKKRGSYLKPHHHTKKKHTVHVVFQFVYKHLSFQDFS